ncbi:polymer-forming cytoskeletal protein [Roseomonas marmotae]|uniref:Polymer-forming cytoskeletal protein n=1 Tax=Roseomonas marmotae TaxID=2768161 RepID=A0ABS3KFB2_9PROT|nr:polymer-forming cytoskeletal protein [Roseomonas marmotae]MBO1075677.1 polymer-forming cytoskeletal protein [Roseomonas marmotae]QTI79535.1 polymer-forming cytoskeletal protein [Roseomonas marmotae]
MSVFRRRREEPTPTQGAPSGLPEGGEPTTVPVARDPDLAVPPFRPAPSKEASAMNLPSKPGQPAGIGVPPRPPSMGGASPYTPAGGSPRPAPAPDRRSMVVGKGISLQGTVTDAERLVVEGTIESQMLHAAELVISHSGVFKGEVEVDDAEIAGIFDGTLTVRGSLIIRGTGKVLGVARCRRLQVEEGGQVSGRMEMLGDNGPAPRQPMPLASSDADQMN